MFTYKFTRFLQFLLHRHIIPILTGTLQFDISDELNDLLMSTKVLINELRDITEVILLYPDLKVDRQICNMTTIQKALFDLFNLSKFT